VFISDIGGIECGGIDRQWSAGVRPAHCLQFDTWELAPSPPKSCDLLAEKPDLILPGESRKPKPDKRFEAFKLLSRCLQIPRPVVAQMAAGR
jgi:hypothetical protein